jgi:hypothetical protein
MELCRSPQIGLEFIALRYFTSDCSDYRSHAPGKRRSRAMRAGPTRTPLRSIARS